VIEVAPLPYTPTLTPPQPTPEEIIPEKGDFPYLTPLPGTKFSGGRLETDPFAKNRRVETADRRCVPKGK
jgi:hypothetical protein